MHSTPLENYETVRRHRDGSSVDVSLTISPVRNAEGTIIGASKIARDITRRKRAEAREKMLTAELDHRVKNTLAQVAAIAKSTREGSRSVDEFVQSLDRRIQSLTAAHTLLAQNDWHGVGVDALVRSQLAPYKHACALGCEGIVSERLGSPYKSGRSAHWVKVKNPVAPAVRREAEEDWNR